MMPGELPLIRTKLAPPRVGNAPLSRVALLRQLDDRVDRKLTLVVGPAGCGKTLLLTQWRRALLLRGAKVAWFNAGIDDSDAQIASYIVEALQQAGLTIDREPLHVYVRSDGKAFQGLVASLINDIADHGGPVYLIIDDLHLISSFSALNLLDRWLSMAPDNFHLVLGSRRRPPLQLSRLRAADNLTELAFAELRFSRDETHRFLQAQALSGISAVQENTLHEMTDGWAAGLQLLAFSLRKQKNPERFFEQQAHRSLSRAEALGEYLEAIVAEHLSSEELDFLMRISVCRRFNRELCELLTGDARAAEHLARFENDNLFLFPIDTADVEPWYRFHRLFASFLSDRLHRQGAEEVRRVHHLASHWFDAKGLHLEAMRHATLAGDTDFLVQLIDGAARRMVIDANFVDLLKWCEAVPRASLSSRLNVCLCLAWSQLSCSRLDEFEATLQDIARHPDHAAPEVDSEVQLLRAYHHLRRDDTRACLQIIEPMMQASVLATPFQTRWRSAIFSLCLVNTNQFERARDVARHRHPHVSARRPDDPRQPIEIINGLSHLVQGNIRLATAALTTVIDDALSRASFGVNTAGMFAGYLLEAFYQSGSVRAARAFLGRYLKLIDAAGIADGLLFAYRVQSRIQQLDGHIDAAVETLQRLEEIGYQNRLDRIVAWSLQEQVALTLRSGRSAPIRDLLGQLDRLAERDGDATHGAWGEIVLAARLAHAMVAFDKEPGSTGLVDIEAAQESATVNRRLLLSTQLGFMRAVVLKRNGSADESHELGRRMALVAADAGMLRVLPDLGRSAVPLIEDLLQQAFEPAVVDLLQAARSELTAAPVAALVEAPSASPGERTPSSLPVETLSVREHEILVLLGNTLSNKSIARAIGVSPGTVKWHLKNVYGKLDAASREDAIAKARALKILG